MVELFYTTYISVDLAHHEIFRAEVGKGGINLQRLSTLLSVQALNKGMSYSCASSLVRFPAGFYYRFDG